MTWMLTAVLGDDIIAAVMVVFCINLVPMLMHSKTAVPWYAGVITSTGLFVIGVVFFLLGLGLSGVTSVVQGMLWAMIAAFRSDLKLKLGRPHG